MNFTACNFPRWRSPRKVMGERKASAIKKISIFQESFRFAFKKRQKAVCRWFRIPSLPHAFGASDALNELKKSIPIVCVVTVMSLLCYRLWVSRFEGSKVTE
jgi:hypothetical protein